MSLLSPDDDDDEDDIRLVWIKFQKRKSMILVTNGSKHFADYGYFFSGIYLFIFVIQGKKDDKSNQLIIFLLL
ncbi:hypothetical protein DERP_004086 [Dermatophagoides pteronyssinus]|uniref:Uncharacterized protein n=1 Tax=Dermatophagoides pteronyssinus TaxID=6956 RepID=A0ABQ8J854_DERPT|nr:hypothetical protein DERP_004086 [Dermatophagoides pteronyssinus]